MAKNGHPKVRYVVVGLRQHCAGGSASCVRPRPRNSELAAVISGEKKKLSVVGNEYGVAARGHYDDLETVIRAAKIDAVYIALPNAMHAEMTARAVRAGAHVLCEKPMAVDARECKAMIRVARQREKKLMIAYRLHFDEGNLAAIDVAAQRRDWRAPRLFHHVLAGGSAR